MSIETLRQALPEFAKDLKLNLSKVLSDEGLEGLTANQTLGIALACAYAIKNTQLVEALVQESQKLLSEADFNAAKAAASIMAMNNVYYRSVHLLDDQEVSQMPTNLRMTIIGNPGVEKVDFELMSIAVSAINGCGWCIQAHARVLEKAGVSKLGIQSAMRIASVLEGTAQALYIQSVG